MITRRTARWVVVMLLASAGCGGQNAAAVKKETSHVRLITMLYARASSRLGHGPKDEQEFKDAIKHANISPEALKLSSIEDVFVSERDGKPLVVVYGGQRTGSDVVVYEQTGVDGMRMLGHTIGSVETVDEARFGELVPAAPSGK